MIKLVACSEAARLDSAYELARAAINLSVLMEDASVYGSGTPSAPGPGPRGAGFSGGLVAVCGSGNNGGDAWPCCATPAFPERWQGRRDPRRQAGRRHSLGEVCYARVLSGPSGAPRPGMELRCARPASAFSRRPRSSSTVSPAPASRDGCAKSSTPLLECPSRSGAPIASIDLPSGLSDSFEVDSRLSRQPGPSRSSPERRACISPRPRLRGRDHPHRRRISRGCAVAAIASLLAAGDLADLAPPPPDSAYKGERGRVGVSARARWARAERPSSLPDPASRRAPGFAALFASRELYPSAAACSRP